MGWWIALGIIVLLAVLPLGVSVCYDAAGALVRLVVGPLKITLFPRSKKEKKPKKEKKTGQKKKSPQKKNSPQKPETKPGEPVKNKAESVSSQQPTAGKQETKQSGGPITDFLPLVKILLEMLGAFRRRLRLNLLELKIVMAADDPCDLAVNYGRAWAAVGNLMPQLEKVFVIQKRNIDVECDFEADKTLVTARLDLTITLGRILATVVVYGIRLLVEFLKINKKRKGGASK